MSQGACTFEVMEQTPAILLAAAVTLAVAATGVAVVLGASLRGRRRTSESVADGGGLARIEVQLAEREREVAEVQTELDEARRERDCARRELAAAQTELAAVKADHNARTEELASAREQLDNQFRGLAARVLKDSTDTLLKQAKEQFDSQRQLGATELEQRQKAIDGLVKPIRESLERLGEHADEIERKRLSAYEGLTSQVTSLQKVAGSLSEALRSPNIRGQWAEQELGNILELSGLRQHVDYVPQRAVSVAGRRVRPDAVVSVPGGLRVVIDAKAPMENYLKAHEADDGDRERELLTSHAADISRHVKALGERDYADIIAGSPDFVLMFVPADPILDSALKVQPTLWERSYREHRVLIATPGTLLAYLRTVALAWQQQDMQKNAQEIADLGQELYDRLRSFVDHMEHVGAGLAKALAAYNRGVGSLQGRVLPQARRFEDLAAVSDAKRIPELSSVEETVRAVNRREEALSASPPSSVLPDKLTA